MRTLSSGCQPIVYFEEAQGLVIIVNKSEKTGITKRLIRNVYTAILGMKTKIKMVLAIMSHEIVS